MKIVFWSPVAGQGCTTSAMLSIATYIALAQRKRVAMISGNFTNHGMQTPFTGFSKEEALMGVASTLGMDALFRDAKGDRLTKSGLQNAALSLTDKLSLYLCPSSSKIAVMESTFKDTCEDIIGELDRVNDYTMIETRGGVTALNQKILGTADIIVICFNQNQAVMETYFNKYHFKGDRIFYVIGNYDRNQIVSMKNVRKYFKVIKSSNSGVIPHCSGFSDAMNQGKLLQWMSVNKECKSPDINFPYVKEVNLITTKLFAMASAKKGGVLK